MQFLPTEEFLAIQPQAVGQYYALTKSNVVMQGDTAIVPIEGPILQRKNDYWASYEEILDLFDSALELSPRRVVLRIDSPGGAAQGNESTSRALREKAESAGVELIAFSDSLAASAAYGLATAASRFVIGKSAMVGSIGTILSRVSYSKMFERVGIQVDLIKSGKRKGDGSPYTEMSDEERASLQQIIDKFSSMFFEQVSDHGYGGSVAAIKALEAGVFIGSDAVDKDLAHEVMEFSALMAWFETEDRKMKEKDDLAQLQEELKALKQERQESNAALQQERAELQKMRAEIEQERVASLVSKHVARGAVAPAQRDFYMQIAALEGGKALVEAHLESLPAQMADRPEDEDSVTAVSAESPDEKFVREELGFTKEEWANG